MWSGGSKHVNILEFQKVGISKNQMIKDSEAWGTGISYNLALVLSNCVIDLVGPTAQERTLEGLNRNGFVKIGSQTEEPCALEVKADAIEA